MWPPSWPSGPPPSSPPSSWALIRQPSSSSSLVCNSLRRPTHDWDLHESMSKRFSCFQGSDELEEAFVKIKNSETSPLSWGKLASLICTSARLYICTSAIGKVIHPRLYVHQQLVRLFIQCYVYINNWQGYPCKVLSSNWQGYQISIQGLTGMYIINWQGYPSKVIFTSAIGKVRELGMVKTKYKCKSIHFCAVPLGYFCAFLLFWSLQGNLNIY